ncbi:beta-1,3-galactosyltransferase 1 isoform X2 [Opisthocomus hoazin]|uniref:beta-1,3-galactosyltransferase 1 isoform X2 n=1 Tax=Opisthocomus hoazin TaxID=30419 RepID=UPI003F52FB28
MKPTDINCRKDIRNNGIPMYSPHWFHMWQGGKQTEEDGSRYGADKQERKIKDKKTEQFLKNQTFMKSAGVLIFKWK